MTSWPWRGDGVRTKQLTFEPSTICRLLCVRRLMVWALTRRWTTSDAGRRFKQPSTALPLLAERSQLAALPEAFSFDTRRLVQTEKVITGSRHSTRAEFMETMEIMALGIVKPVIGMRTHFTGLGDIFRAVTHQTLSGRGAPTHYH